MGLVWHFSFVDVAWRHQTSLSLSLEDNFRNDAQICAELSPTIESCIFDNKAVVHGVTSVKRVAVSEVAPEHITFSVRTTQC